MEMKSFRVLCVLLLMILLFLPALSAGTDEGQFRAQRLSDRVLVLTENSEMENIVVALASKKGLVVVDTLGTREAAFEMREVIEKEFGRTDFVYVINTHHHWDHSNGNKAFSEAVLIAHERCLEVLEQARRTSSETEEWKFPDRAIGFKDRMTLDLGDLTLKLVYFGRAHSGSDILIQVSEEGLILTGDLFLERGWLPLFSGQRELDIPRWIDALSYVLDGEQEVKLVIPGHRDIWKPEKLDFWRDYIVWLWGGIVKADSQGLDLEAVDNLLKLDEKYSYLNEYGHSDAEIQRFHKRNIRAFWGQLKTPAAVIIERVIDEAGISAAKEKYKELRSKKSDEYFFDEFSFNALGYRMIQSSRIEEAIEVFKWNVESYPHSWNVYDSLGEAYMYQRNNEEAIKNYKKSLELNPDNDNAKRMLERLKGNK